MKPEWVMVAVAIVLAMGQLLNVFLTLTVKNQVKDMRQEILDRVAAEYKRQDVCHSDMDALRVSRRQAC